MLRTLAGGACCSVLLCAPLAAQSPSAPAASAASAAAPAFDVADVHGSARTTYPYMRGGTLHGDRYMVRDATMVDLIAAAYKVDPANVVGGPSWLELDRFDIQAKAPSATSQETVALMLRGLLAERFKLEVHTAIQPQPAYVLSAGKSSKLKEADSSGDGGCQYQPPPKGTAPDVGMTITFSCHNTTMESFTAFLHQVGSPYLPRPVIDSTGLKGAWDFDIRWSYQPPKGADGITLFDAVDKQLGLKLELKTTPLPVVVVNRVDEAPTPNAPDLAKNLPPPPPAEFEVATIRPHAPKEKHFGIQINGGTIHVYFGSLETLIAFAWDIDKMMIVRGAFVLDQDQDFFDVEGKAASDGSAGVPGSGRGVDIDDLRLMMRSLLADRFKLKVHTEDRPFDAYTLFADIPKMKKADPANRASCKDGPAPGGKDPRIGNPWLTRSIWCQNMTMAQFAANLRSYAPGNIKTTVLDATGLKDGYDFALYWSGENDGPPPPPPPSADGSTASDPTTAISLQDAMKRQLGLRLDKQKRPVSMLVIDHIEEKPTEN